MVEQLKQTIMEITTMAGNSPELKKQKKKKKKFLSVTRLKVLLRKR